MTIYQNLYSLKNKESLSFDYKIAGSAALKLATVDTTWENDDVDIMIQTIMDANLCADALGLPDPIKTWTKGVDPMNKDREENFHDRIVKVLTFRVDGFNKNIQLVFFQNLSKLSFTDFLDDILDYPAHVLYEVDFDTNAKMSYNFYLPTKMWGNIVEKQIPKNMHCLKSAERIEKYMGRGFSFI